MRSKLRVAVTAVAMLLLVVIGIRPSSAVELEAIAHAASFFQAHDPHVTAMYRAALLNTARQATFARDGTAYVKTGDIPAEWLRDASAQVRPYLFFAKKDMAVSRLLRGIIAREARYLEIDPYANAFTLDYRVWERKFELDSLNYPIELAWTYWTVTGDASIFDADLGRGFDRALETMEREQDHPHHSHYWHHELAERGAGRPVGYTGMIWTGFRPSDDACQYNYLIPAEMMAVVALGELEAIERDVYHDLLRAHRARSLREEVQNGIQTFGIIFTPNYGYVYAYEVDGLGNANLMDDANIPSLLSAPYLGYTRVGSPVYQNTRRFLLSRDNPYYYVGRVARGIGSAHTNDGWIWPLSLLMEGFTSSGADERARVLRELLASDPGDHLLHESFDPNSPLRFSRRDFGWPNALLAEYLLTTVGGMTPLPVGSTSDLEFRGE